MARLPDKRGRANPNLEYLGSSNSRVEDAEWADVADGDGTPPQQPHRWSCLTTGLTYVGGVVVAIVLTGVILVSLFGGGTEDDASTASPTETGELTFDSSELSEKERQTELCAGDDTTEYVQNTGRTWLRNVLSAMATDGVLVLPAVNKPIDRMVIHAKIDWIGGPPRFVDEQIVDGNTTITCRAGMVFRDAVMLPDGSWSDAEISIPDMNFDLYIPADSDLATLSMDLGKPDEAMTNVNITVAGATMSLAEFYDFVLSNPAR